MKVCIVGGIFDKPLDYQTKHIYTPETILAKGLETEGIHVDKVGLSKFHPMDKYDVIHIHHLSPAAIEMASFSSNAMFVFTSHNGQIICDYEKSLFRNIAYRHILRHSDGIVALSKFEANSIVKIGIQLDKVSMIPNGIPSNIYYPSQQKNVGTKYNILFVGQLIDLKGVDILLKAFSFIKSEYDANLLLVYQGNQNEKIYKEMALALGIADKVQFMGFLSATELADLYRNIDILVLPSYAEALPSVVTEALLSGVPIVASKIGGIPEQIDSCGVLIKPGDVQDLKRGICEVIDHLEKYRDRVLQSLAQRAIVYSVPSMISSHIELYNRLLSGHKFISSKRMFIYPIFKIARKAKEILWKSA